MALPSKNKAARLKTTVAAQSAVTRQERHTWRCAIANHPLATKHPLKRITGGLTAALGVVCGQSAALA